MQREQWNETLNNDVLLTRIENLERKLQVKLQKSFKALTKKFLKPQKYNFENIALSSQYTSFWSGIHFEDPITIEVDFFASLRLYHNNGRLKTVNF